MVFRLFINTRSVFIQSRLAIKLLNLYISDKHIVLRVNNLKGKGFSCRENRCWIETGLTRLGKVAIGKVRYLLNIVLFALKGSSPFFSVLWYLLKSIV
jgi:N6-adenosine-specific RNA methylase IME4